MVFTDVLKRTLAGELRLFRGRVLAVEPDGRVRVQLGPAPGEQHLCEVVRTSVERIVFEPGAEVLIACDDGLGSRGVVLGVVGPVEATANSPGATEAPAGQPLRLQGGDIVIDAGEELTLRCGEASIRITRDGKIVIRGEHILSRAKGTQRIKGGSVAIN
jgi:hypothetical protein